MEHPYYATGKVIAYNSKIFSFFKPFPNKTLGSESEYVGGEVFLQPTDSLMKKANFVNARLTLTLSKNKNSVKKLIKDILCESPEYGKKMMSLVDKDLVLLFIYGYALGAKT